MNKDVKRRILPIGTRSFKAALRAAEIEMYGEPCSDIDEVEFLWNKISEVGSIYVGDTNSSTSVGAPIYIHQNLTSSGLNYTIEVGSI